MNDTTPTGPTPGPYVIEYAPYPCAKNGAGEPNPDAAFVGPRDEDAIALVFGRSDDPFDVPSLRANAHLLASSWDFLAACTPERIQATDCLLAHVNDPEARHEIILAMELLAGLRAAVAKAKGGAA